MPLTAPAGSYEAVQGHPQASDTLSGDPEGQEILAAWIGKEKLREVLNMRLHARRKVRSRLASLYDWCAPNHDIPELIALARAIAK